MTERNRSPLSITFSAVDAGRFELDFIKRWERGSAAAKEWEEGFAIKHLPKDDQWAHWEPFNPEESEHKDPEPKAPIPAVAAPIAEPRFSQRRKWAMLLIFSMAQYLDVACYSGVLIFTTDITRDLNIPAGSSSWVITAYGVTFASCLLFWGRVSDLYSAKPVFCFGFGGLGIANLILSFMPSKYAYFVVRALAGVFASATIPSAFRLIPEVFEPHEMNVAISLFGLSGGVGNTTGIIFAGFFGFITAHNQDAGWRWFFRMIAFVAIPFAVFGVFLIPHTRGAMASQARSRIETVQRTDYVGAFLMFSGIVLIILGLTLGATNGFRTASFLAPFLLSWVMFVAFFIWEWRIPTAQASLPPSFWFLPNMPLLMSLALIGYANWSVAIIGLFESWELVHHQSAIITAVRYLPPGIVNFLVAPAAPKLLAITSPRWPISGALAMVAIGYVIIIYSHGDIVGLGYWRFVFPAFIVGQGVNMVLFLATNATILTSVPPEQSGVAGAMFAVCSQLGNAVAFSVQAGLFTVHPGGVTNFGNVQASFWFQFGWEMLMAILTLAFYRDKAAPRSEMAQQLEQKAESADTAPVRQQEVIGV